MENDRVGVGNQVGGEHDARLEGHGRLDGADAALPAGSRSRLWDGGLLGRQRRRPPAAAVPLPHLGRRTARQPHRLQPPQPDGRQHPRRLPAQQRRRLQADLPTPGTQPTHPSRLGPRSATMTIGPIDSSDDNTGREGTRSQLDDEIGGFLVNGVVTKSGRVCSMISKKKSLVFASMAIDRTPWKEAYGEWS